MVSMNQNSARPARRSFARVALVAISILGSAAALGLSGQPAPTSYMAVSRPSDVRELGFPVRGRIGAQLIQPGDRIKKDQPLFRLDDAVQRQNVAMAKLSAEDESKLRLAKTSLTYREEDLRITQDSLSRGGAAEADLREATFRRDSAVLELAQAQHEHALNQATLDRERAQLDQMAIISPIDATVLELKKRPGETVEEGGVVVTIVNTDVLWLDVNLPTADALALKLGQGASVLWDDLPNQQPMAGKIIFISPYGHGGARQIVARVEVPNTPGLPAGLHASVTFQVPALPESSR